MRWSSSTPATASAMAVSFPAGRSGPTSSTSWSSPSALLKMGEGTAADAVVRQAARAGRPIFEAHTVASGQGALCRQTVPGLCRHRPSRKILRHAARRRRRGGALEPAFPDHHFYGEDELAELAATARREGLGLVTTAKDAARLRHGTAPAEFPGSARRAGNRRRVRARPRAGADHRRDAGCVAAAEVAGVTSAGCAAPDSLPSHGAARRWRSHKAPAWRRSNI